MTTDAVDEGWNTASIESLAEPKGISYGVLKPGPQVADGVPMLRVSDIQNGEIEQSEIYRISNALDREYRRTKLRGGEVVLSIQGSVGRAAVVPPGLAGANISRTLAMIRLIDPSLAPWVHRALESPHIQQAMRQVVGGTTRDSLNLRDLRRLEIPLAPEGQRSTILHLVGQAESLQESSARHLAIAKRAIVRFRQALLAAACSGRLTADWRDANPPGESAESIVIAIDEARHDRHGRRYKPSNPPEAESDLPDGWCWTTAGALVDVATGATPLRKRADYYNGTIPWVTSGAVNAGFIRAASEFITETALRETNAKIFPAGTLLVAMYGEGQTRGRVGELAIDAATNQAVAAVLFDEHTEQLKPYLKVFFLENYERIRALSFGGVQPNLSLGAIRDTMLPLPPLDEQIEIVRRVDRLLDTASTLSQRIASASRRVERSSQAVLAKAFRGELIPTGIDEMNGDLAAEEAH